jgi:hypothetical protein
MRSRGLPAVVDCHHGKYGWVAREGRDPWTGVAPDPEWVPMGPACQRVSHGRCGSSSRPRSASVHSRSRSSTRATDHAAASACTNAVPWSSTAR